MKACRQCGYAVEWCAPDVSRGRHGHWMHTDLAVLPPERREATIFCDQCQDKHPVCYIDGIREEDLAEV